MSKIGTVEKKVVKFLYGRQIQLSYLKRMIICKDSNEKWARSISRLLSKGLVEVHRDVANLTPKGILLARYLNPFPSSLEEKKHQTTILITPEKVSQETGYSVVSIRTKQLPFHYLTCFKTIQEVRNLYQSYTAGRLCLRRSALQCTAQHRSSSFSPAGLVWRLKCVLYVQSCPHYCGHGVDFFLLKGVLSTLVLTCLI